MDYTSSIIQKVLLVFFFGHFIAFATGKDFDLVAIADYNQKAKQAVVQTLRNRANIPQKQVQELVEARLLSWALNGSDEKARFLILRHQTPEGSIYRTLRIRRGMVRDGEIDLPLESYLKRLNIDLLVGEQKKREQATPSNGDKPSN